MCVYIYIYLFITLCTLCTGWILKDGLQNNQTIVFSKFKFKRCYVFTARLTFWSTEKHKVATKTISYKRYREILFQKFASGYLLHFVQDGSSTNSLENCFLRNSVKNTTNILKIPINPPHLDQLATLKGPISPFKSGFFTGVLTSAGPRSCNSIRTASTSFARVAHKSSEQPVAFAAESSLGSQSSRLRSI